MMETVLGEFLLDDPDSTTEKSTGEYWPFSH